MLNFLKTPNSEIPAEQDTETTQPKEQDFLTVATKEKEVRKSTTILGVLFIIGLICLGIMIKKSAPQAAVSKTVDAEELRLETDIQRVFDSRKDFIINMDEIVNKFYELSDIFQIGVNQLVKNPFQLETLIKSNVKDNGESDLNVEMIIQKEIELKARELKLYSVMKSEKGVCCMVNNKILYEGENIDDFVVKKIDTDNVLLEMNGVEIKLKLSK